MEAKKVVREGVWSVVFSGCGLDNKWVCQFQWRR